MVLKNVKFIISSIEFKIYDETGKYVLHGLPGGDNGKESACQGRRHEKYRFDPWAGRFPGEGAVATHSNILAWRIPWTEEPGGLQSIGLQRVGHDWSDLAHTKHMSCILRRKVSQQKQTQIWYNEIYTWNYTYKDLKRATVNMFMCLLWNV